MSWFSTDRLPRPHDAERLAVAWTRWRETTAAPDSGAAEALLDSLFGNSPYLTETALQNPSFMADLWRDGPDAVIERLEADVAAVLAKHAAAPRPRPSRRACAG
jgi:glutamate-ammonia-ligase adenylyltransferase